MASSTILAPLDAPKLIKPAVKLVLALNCVDNLVSELCTLPSPTSEALVPLLILDTEVVAESAKSVTLLDVILILAALIVPVVITLPSIAVTFEFTCVYTIGLKVVLPSVRVLEPLKVTRPLNPMA